MVEEEGPDRCRVIAGSWSWTGLAAWAGIFEVDLDIVGPPELVEAAAHLAERFERAAARSRLSPRSTGGVRKRAARGS